MRLLIINPNTSVEMTETINAAAKAAVDDAVTVDTVCPDYGPASIEGVYDEVVSAYWTVDKALRLVEAYDGLIIACFSAHPATNALREALSQPVIGVMEAAILQALPLGSRFSIVTTSPRWTPLLEEGVRMLGVESRCASVRSTGLAVLDLEALSPQDVRARLIDVSRQAVEADGAEVICLGCAGMAGLEEDIHEVTGLPVVDGVRAALALMRGLVDSDLQTSKRNLYRPVEPRPADGLPAGIARGYGHDPV